MSSGLDVITQILTVGHREWALKAYLAYSLGFRSVSSLLFQTDLYAVKP